MFNFQHGADVNRKNRDGHTPLDLVRDSDQDVADLLRGDAALLDAAKKGMLARVQKLLTSENINCRDSQVCMGRVLKNISFNKLSLAILKAFGFVHSVCLYHDLQTNSGT